MLTCLAGSDADHPKAHWAVVIFASRESVCELVNTVRAARIAAGQRPKIDIIVNGNSALAFAVAEKFTTEPSPLLCGHFRVWFLSVADKANAWNEYIRHIWSGETISFFIDGYVRLNPDAISLLGGGVALASEALGGTGVPKITTKVDSSGQPSFARGFHGNFCCIKGSAMEEMRRRHIALPFGLYRVDSLMGAFLNIGLDSSNAWVENRILVHPAASWQTDQKLWWHFGDIGAQIKRVFRQSRGVLENFAVRDHLRTRKQSPESLPATASELVLSWALRCPDQAAAVFRRNPLTRWTITRIRHPPIDQGSHTPPQLLASRAL